MPSKFNEAEASVIRELHDSFVAGKVAVEADQLADKCGISHSDLESLRIRLKNYGAIERSNADGFVVSERVVEVVKELNVKASSHGLASDEAKQGTSPATIAAIAIGVGVPLVYVWWLILRDLAALLTAP